MLSTKDCFLKRGMPIENALCPEMYKLATENKFVFYKTWEDDKDYSKTFEDGFSMTGDHIITIDKLHKNEDEFNSLCVTEGAYTVGLLYTDY